MKISTVQSYPTKEEAESRAQRCRETGHPAATAIENSNGKWVISKHRPVCKCGLCPVLQTNGFFE